MYKNWDIHDWIFEDGIRALAYEKDAKAGYPILRKIISHWIETEVPEKYREKLREILLPSDLQVTDRRDSSVQGDIGTMSDKKIKIQQSTIESVNHPTHYGGGGKDNPYEAINVIEAWGLGFCLGNTVKYISRAGKKGNKLEDLKKAQWYLIREIENLENNEIVTCERDGNYER